MPILRNSKSKKLELPLDNSKGDTGNLETKRSIKSMGKEFKKLISAISISDIKTSLRSSSSEAKFYSGVCEEELKKLLAKREEIDRKIKAEAAYCMTRNTEASKIIMKLLDETNRRIRQVKQKSNLQKTVGLNPNEIRRVFHEAKKLSENFKLKRKKRLLQRFKVDKEIKRAQNTIQFCKRFIKTKELVRRRNCKSF